MVTIVLVVVVLTLMGAAYGIYTHRGSGIEDHPRGGDHVGSPGVGEGKGRMATGTDERDDAPFDSHGSH
jgi:hypothetical protein